MLHSVQLGKSLLRIEGRKMGSLTNLLSKVTNLVDRDTTAFRVEKYEASMPLEGHEPIIFKDLDREYNISKLYNGFTVLTETASFPAPVHLGFLMDLGTRDEISELSGSCQAIKNTYLKTIKHTNETMNYGMIQMTGGDLEMEFDQEKMYYRGYCMEYDVTDMLQVLVDVALEPKSVIASNVARAKNEKVHQFKNHMKKYDPFCLNLEHLMTTAYGYKTLGMPLSGLSSNIERIDSNMLQEFLIRNLTPNKCIISASGIKNHKEFVDAVSSKLNEFLPAAEFMHKREKAEYLGGEHRIMEECESTNIILAYESVPWSHSKMPAFAILQTLIGSATPFSTGGPGKGMHCRAIKNVFQRYGFVESIDCVNSTFSDSGVFGLNILGASTHSKELLDVIMKELHLLREPVPLDELNRAKNILKINILLTIERQGDRLEEITKNYLTFNDLTFQNYCQQIDAITSDDINDLAESLLKGKPTLIATGSSVNELPNTTQIHEMLN